LLSALGLCGASCATSVSGFQPAHVAPKGHAQAEVSLEIVVPTGTLSSAIDAGKTLAATLAPNSPSLTSAQQRQLVDAGAALALNPPGAVNHLGLSYTPVARLEASLRYSSGAWRLGARYQFLEQDRSGVDLSAGVGGQRQVVDFPVGDVIGILDVKEFTRWSVDVPMLVGRHGRWYRCWAGPRFIWSQYSGAITLAPPNQAAETASVDGQSVHVGGLAGAALGYRWVFVGFELTVVKLISTAHVKLPDNQSDADLGGWVIAPTFGLMGEF
jgi:hypothetical protein